MITIHFQVEVEMTANSRRLIEVGGGLVLLFDTGEFDHDGRPKTALVGTARTHDDTVDFWRVFKLSESCRVYTCEVEPVDPFDADRPTNFTLLDVHVTRSTRNRDLAADTCSFLLSHGEHFARRAVAALLQGVRSDEPAE